VWKSNAFRPHLIGIVDIISRHWKHLERSIKDDAWHNGSRRMSTDLIFHDLRADPEHNQTGVQSESPLSPSKTQTHRNGVRVRPFHTLIGVLLLTTAVFLSGTGTVQAKSKSKVFLNGVPTPVYFNDGDSFAVLKGPLSGTRGRLAGFNTLESYGPVHRWGTWTRQELYHLAKEGTLNARRGVWTCTSDMKKDFYGRTLWDCPDLAEDQIRKGLAHALTVTRLPAREVYLEAQRDAIAHRRGIWAHGVPDFILTSTHSAAESAGTWNTYNRLVSSADGHSEKWYHDNAYEECFDVCLQVAPVDKAWLEAAAAGLKSGTDDGDVDALIGRLKDTQLNDILIDYLKLGFSNRVEDAELHSKVMAAIEAIQTGGAVAKITRSPGSCMLYVDYRRRFGLARASCLKKK